MAYFCTWSGEPVRVSMRESMLLQTYEDILRTPRYRDDPKYAGIIAKAEALIAACDRVGEWKRNRAR